MGSRRHFLRGAGGIAVGLAAGGVLPAHQAHADSSRGWKDADLIVYNARVLVLDRAFRIAEAIAVRGGVVQAVGRAKDIRRLVGRRTQVLDAGGGTVLPGIN